MNSKKISIYKASLFSNVLLLFLVLTIIVLLSLHAQPVRSFWDQNASLVSSPSSPEAIFDEPPIAADDSGLGFHTDEDSMINTPNVLANDIDNNGDGLFVSNFNSTQTIGLVNKADGGLDPTFGQDGKVTISIGWLDEVRELVIQPDGKIILVGGSTDINGFLVLRYNTDGSLDSSFNGDGIAVADFGTQGRALAVVYQPDNKIIATGHLLGNNLGVARFNPDGSLDLTFGEDGMVTTTGVNFQDSIYMGISLQVDGKIVAVGTCYDNAYEIGLVRFNPDGSLDTTFDEDGFVQAGVSNYSTGYDVAVQPDNKILVSGFGIDAFGGSILARFNSDGSLDNSLGGDGIVLTDVGPINYNSLGKAMALQPDNKIVVAGNTNDFFTLLRYNPDGSLDDTFNGDGIVQATSINSSDIVIQPSGLIAIAGISGIGGECCDMAIVRYTTDGYIDTSFGDEGMDIVDFGDGRGYAIAHGPSGMMYVTGTVGGDIGLARVFSDGSFSYDPNHRFDYLSTGQEATDAFEYTVSDGIFTDTAMVTITIVGGIEYIYLPIMISQNSIHGYVTENGAPAAEIALDLRYFDGSSWSTFASTITDVDGYYSFLNLPNLFPGQMYYVRYLNNDNPNRLWLWQTKEITSFMQNPSVNIGNFDISNIELMSPDYGAVVTLPATFQWETRLATPFDSYEFNLYDYEDYDPYFYTDPPLGYTGSYTLNSLPPGFVYGYYYVWEIWVYSPDGGTGVSFFLYDVLFSNPVRTGLDTTLSIQPRERSNLEYHR